nr:MAG TPA: hypothetical protein [Caudoviricetes sp.]
MPTSTSCYECRLSSQLSCRSALFLCSPYPLKAPKLFLNR